MRVGEPRVVPRVFAAGLGAVEGGDGCLVGDAAGADGPVGEKARDKVKGAHDDGGAGHVEVELAVGGSGRGVAVFEVLLDGGHAVGAVAMCEGLLVQLLEELGLERDVVAV